MKPTTNAFIPRITILVVSLIVLAAAAEVRSQAVTIDLIRGCENNKTTLVVDDLNLWSIFWPMGTTEDGRL